MASSTRSGPFVHTSLLATRISSTSTYGSSSSFFSFEDRPQTPYKVTSTDTKRVKPYIWVSIIFVILLFIFRVRLLSQPLRQGTVRVLER
jgi:hypothetical protein